MLLRRHGYSFTTSSSSATMEPAGTAFRCCNGGKCQFTLHGNRFSASHFRFFSLNCGIIIGSAHWWVQEIPVETQKFIQPQDVHSRLAELGLTEHVLWDAVRRSELAFRNSTANHPPLYAGFVSWAEAVRGLREVLLPSGWRKC